MSYYWFVDDGFHDSLTGECAIGIAAHSLALRGFARASQKHFTGLAEELTEDRLAVIILEEATQTHGTQYTSYS